MQYGETLPLNDHEVVLTFDDGPLPPYTNRILDTLASQCVKATFFMVGRMVQGYPAVVRRIYNEGHTVANHSQSHPFTFHRMTVDQAAREIEDGFASLQAALGDPKAVARFFRIPGLLRQNSVEQYLAAHGDMTWSVDFLADDWTHINNREIARRAISRIEARGKGILLLHDIQPATALAFPEILKELKARGFKIVHVVPAAADRPEPVLAAPSPANFGIEQFGPVIKVAMAQTFERQTVQDAQPPAIPWPSAAAYAVSPEADVLPVPAAYNFKYSRPLQLGHREKPTIVRKKNPTTVASRQSPFATGFFGAWPAQQRQQRAFGHQLSVARPA